MRKREFIRELSRRLGDMPEKERENVIDYYDELIEDTIERTNKSEEEVIYELGSINDIVKRVKPAREKIHYEEEIIEIDDEDIIREERDSDDYEEYKKFKAQQARKAARKEKVEVKEEVSNKKSDNSDGSLIIAKVLILILTFPIWFGLMSGLIGCIIGFTAAGIGIGVGGVASIIIGVSTFASSVTNAIFYIGVGLALIGLACIIFPLLVKFVVFLFKLLVRFIKWVFKTKKEND